MYIVADATSVSLSISPPHTSSLFLVLVFFLYTFLFGFDAAAYLLVNQALPYKLCNKPLLAVDAPHTKPTER